MKRIVSVLLALSLLWAFLGAAAGEPAAEVYFSKTWIGCAAYGYNRNVPVLVATNDPARGRMTAEDVAGEILYFPFDGAAGLYAAGEGEPAGERAEILYLSEDRTVWTVKLNEPERFIRLARACLTADTYGELDRIHCPVLVLGGREDRVVTAEASEEIAARLGCPIYMYEGLGHSAYEEAPDFNQRALAFLNGVNIV